MGQCEYGFRQPVLGEAVCVSTTPTYYKQNAGSWVVEPRQTDLFCP